MRNLNNWSLLEGYTGTGTKKTLGATGNLGIGSYLLYHRPYDLLFMVSM